MLNGGANTAPAVSAATNRLSGSSYYANGNMLTGVGATFTCDGRNRLFSAAPTSGGTEYYGYAPDNKRVYRQDASGNEAQTFCGARGERICDFGVTLSAYGPTVSFNAKNLNVSFGGKLVAKVDAVGYFTSTVRDRVGTNRETGARYYPYGQEITSTPNDTEKFGTYVRDSFTTLDYADQRYYASSYGRFSTVDHGPAQLEDPQSLNRYPYAGGDPVNSNDPSGLCTVDTHGNFWSDDDRILYFNDGATKLWNGNVGGPCTSSADWVEMVRGRGGVWYDDEWVFYPELPSPEPCLDSGGCGSGSGQGPADDAPPPGGGNGGGGSGPFGPSITDPTQAKGLLLKALDFWKNCDHILGTLGDTLAKNLKFSNSGKNDPHNGTWLASSGPGNRVTLYTNFYGNPANGQYLPATEQAATLVHELFHKVFRLTKLDHSDFLGSFPIPWKGGFASTGKAIDDWIRNDRK